MFRVVSWDGVRSGAARRGITPRSYRCAEPPPASISRCFASIIRSQTSARWSSDDSPKILFLLPCQGERVVKNGGECATIPACCPGRPPVIATSRREASMPWKIAAGIVSSICLLLGSLPALSDEVPLPPEPDWQGSLERAVGTVAWIDANNDGWLDLAVGCYWANAYPPIEDYYNTIYFNQGGMLEAEPSWRSDAERHTTDFRVADINDDSFDDLIVANGGSSFDPNVVYYGGPDGLPTSPGWASADAAWAIGCDLGDVDGDGDLDLATANQGRTGDPYRPVYLFTNTGGVFSNAPTWQSADVGISNAVHFGYADGDSMLDLAVSKWVDWPSGVYYNTGSGLNPNQGWTTGQPERTDKGIGWADVDGDEDQDLVVGGNGDPHQLFENLGNGPVAPPIWESQDSYHGCQELKWADIDEDGDPDLFSVHFGNGHARVHLNVEGVLSPTADWTYDASSSATTIALGDMNRDGHLDLAVATARQPVMVFLNTLPASGLGERGQRTPRAAVESFPQPARSSVTLVRMGDPNAAPGEVLIYGAAGRCVARLPAAAGRNTLRWDLRDEQGRPVGSGVYWVRWLTREAGAGGRILITR
ncbi:MAG: hypothetical protein GF355_01200 [Candidatus Eisenbacteria bacterium]|nr:hypothetical protein [Candidatus Eisenbacteria bacterium]